MIIYLLLKNFIKCLRVYFQFRNYYCKYRAYIESKLAQVMFTYSLQSYLNAEQGHVTVNSVHPGVVNTELMSKVLLLPSAGSLIFKVNIDVFLKFFFL